MAHLEKSFNLKMKPNFVTEKIIEKTEKSLEMFGNLSRCSIGYNFLADQLITN